MGEPDGGRIELRRTPKSVTIPVASIVAATLLVSHAAVTDRGGPLLTASLLVGAVLAGFGLYRLVGGDRRKRAIQPCERGFVYEADDDRVGVLRDQIEQPRIQQIALRTRWAAIGWQIELTFRWRGRWWVIPCFAKERGEAFERWAQQLIGPPAKGAA